MKIIQMYELSSYTEKARGHINKIYLHWSASAYDRVFNDYHVNILGDGTIWASDFTERKSHTWRRNTGAVGITLACCQGASITKEGAISWGFYPPTDIQLETMAQIVAKLCVEIGLDVSYDVLTHAEVASIDGYGLEDNDSDMRWDLYGYGSMIRHRALEYINEWKKSW